MVFRLFKKRKKDLVIDLGDLQKRGLIKEPINLSSESLAESGTGFLGSLASVGTSEKSEAGEIAKSTKFENIKEKISLLSERTYKILERLDLLEHKIGRIEKRLNIKPIYEE